MYNPSTIVFFKGSKFIFSRIVNAEGARAASKAANIILKRIKIEKEFVQVNKIVEIDIPNAEIMKIKCAENRSTKNPEIGLIKIYIPAYEYPENNAYSESEISRSFSISLVKYEGT